MIGLPACDGVHCSGDAGATWGTPCRRHPTDHQATGGAIQNVRRRISFGSKVIAAWLFAWFPIMRLGRGGKQNAPRACILRMARCGLSAMKAQSDAAFGLFSEELR
jgi:hypothetical protein